MEHTKTRNLSVGEYFAQLEREYLMADFRRKIYYNPKDKAYYQRVMGYKKEKIQSIAKRNRLLCIFSNDSVLRKVTRELFEENGKPKFEMTDSDKQNYYAVGNEFSFRGEIWTLDQVKADGTLTLYSLEREEYEDVKPEEVSRVL